MTLAWLCAAALAGRPFPAEGPGTTRFDVDAWGLDEGLPQSSITDLAPGPDGYLYDLRWRPDGLWPAAVLVTDVLMPAMNGAELARCALERHPAIRVAFASGYTRDVLPADLDGPLLSKPFALETILAAMRELLAR